MSTSGSCGSTTASAVPSSPNTSGGLRCAASTPSAEFCSCHRAGVLPDRASRRIWEALAD
ncbi:hypothetical protein SE92_17555 [Bradyrhizobium sp. AT1]|nr:hypothetical protein SE92_17555 [Bradyrhizobium sp. AT1]